MAFRVGTPPPFDAGTFVKTLRDRVRKPDGSEYAIFNEAFANLVRWVRGDGTYDGAGKSIVDTINANATQLNAVKGDVDTVNEREKRHYQELRADLDAVMSGSPPFPE